MYYTEELRDNHGYFDLIVVGLMCWCFFFFISKKTMLLLLAKIKKQALQFTLWWSEGLFVTIMTKFYIKLSSISNCSAVKTLWMKIHMPESWDQKIINFPESRFSGSCFRVSNIERVYFFDVYDHILVCRCYLVICLMFYFDSYVFSELIQDWFCMHCLYMVFINRRTRSYKEEEEEKQSQVHVSVWPYY